MYPNVTCIRKKCFKKPPEGDINKAYITNHFNRRLIMKFNKYLAILKEKLYSSIGLPFSDVIKSVSHI